MGTGLADNVSQGTAGGDQFRTAPLWGLGQRIFFLHDGRTTDLTAAIDAHASSGSEANTGGGELRFTQRQPATGHSELPALAVIRAYSLLAPIVAPGEARECLARSFAWCERRNMRSESARLPVFVDASCRVLSLVWRVQRPGAGRPAKRRRLFAATPSEQKGADGCHPRQGRLGKRQRFGDSRAGRRAR